MLLTWYHEYALLAGLIRMVTILARGSKAWARLGTSSLSKYVALFSNRYCRLELLGVGKNSMYLGMA